MRRTPANSRFALPVAGLPPEDRVARGAQWRIQVLTERLIRVEWSPSGVFEDRATQMVIDRAGSVADGASIRIDADAIGGGVRITTEWMSLDYDGCEFSPHGLSARERRNRRWGAQWRWGVDESIDDIHYRNLGGTARTLDNANGRIDLEAGIMDGRGITCLEDSSLALGPAGEPCAREPGSHDCYIFAYGADFRGAIADFYRLTGPQPILPRFTLGNWWSRFHRYDELEYLSILDEFAAHRVPLAVAVLDMDWHLTSLPERFGSGWTGFTWNRDLFPEPEEFALRLHERGLALALNLHPADGIRAYEDAYLQLAARFGVDVACEEPVAFDPADPTFLEAYFDEVLGPLERGGVDFWWVDWQQGTNSRIAGFDPLWMLNHAHVLESARTRGRGVTLSRYAGPGSHRYPIGFSGDTVISWESLAFQPEFTATAANIGFGWWSHDIGGHMGGVADDELATRWVQFGVFSPIMRLHSTVSAFTRKEPWAFPAEHETIQARFLRLRHRLIPYLHSEQLRGHGVGVPLIQPMYWEDPEAEGSWRVPNQYMFGSRLTVAPITAPSSRITGLGAARVWLPEGRWTDIFTGMSYEGGREIVAHRPLSSIPVLGRAGCVLPLAGAEDEECGIANPDSIELVVIVGAGGSYELREDDDGIAPAESVEAGERASTTRFDWDQDSGRLSVRHEGDASVLPERRRWCVKVLGAPAAEVLGVEGAQVRSVGREEGSGALRVELDAIDAAAPFSVSFAGVAPGQSVSASDRLYGMLARCQCSNDLKERLWKELAGASAARALSALFSLGAPESLSSAIAEIFGAG